MSDEQPPIHPVGTALPVSEEDAASLEELNQELAEAQKDLGIAQMQVRRAEAGRDLAVDRVLDVERRLLDRATDVARGMGIDVRDPAYGRWTFEFEQGTLKRVG